MLNDQLKYDDAKIGLSEKKEGEMDMNNHYSPHRGLQFHEPLIFESDLRLESVEKNAQRFKHAGVDVEKVDISNSCLPLDLLREEVGLPNLSEPQVVRHYTRLSQKNFSIDSGMYPLGSCTMKHNPRLNEKVARFPGFANVHPLQPKETIRGCYQVMSELKEWLCELTGLPRVSLSPAAGAQGELCGMLTIKNALKAKGLNKTKVLVPESAHGTNPATAVACGFKVVTIPCDKTGKVDLKAFKELMDEDVAAIMLTNPNTCGLFETEIKEMADLIHQNQGYFYCDGANFNAIVGRVKPGDLGVDVMHINLHKTFSTPHGGGGPGAGPVVMTEGLFSFSPYPILREKHDSIYFEESLEEKGPGHVGRLKAFYGQMGMFTRALTYMKSHGIDGLKQVSGDAVLNANYIRVSLESHMSVAFPGLCMHEVLFNDDFLRGSNITPLDIAKALLDAGYHPMTMYFPLNVSGALLVEPTETETKETLDEFISIMKKIIDKTHSNESEKVKLSPRFTPCKRLDEVKAARRPQLRWQPKN